MTRSVRGIELTAAGRVFLDHARMILPQVEAAAEAARRAAQPAKTSFALGFLTGYEFEWLPPVMTLMRDAAARHRSRDPQPVVARSRRRADARQDRSRLSTARAEHARV